MVIDAGARVLFINRKGEEVLGYARQEIIGKNWFQLVVPTRLKEKLEEAFADLMRGDVHPWEYFENPICTRQGDERLVAWNNTVLRDRRGTITATLSSGIDITEKRKAEEERQFLASIVESSDDGIIGNTLEGIIASWNPGAERIYGYSAEEAKGQPLVMLVPPTHRRELTELLEKLKRGEPVHHLETIRVRKDGTPRFVSLTLSPIRDESQEMIGFSATVRDITARRQAERDLYERDLLIGAIVDTVVDGIFTVDEDLSICSFNPAAEEIFGWKKEEILGHPAGVLFAADPGVEGREGSPPAPAWLRTGDPRSHHEVQGRRADGSTFPMQIGVGAMQLDRRRLFACIVRDLTEFKKVQEENVRSQSLATLGEMAASIAHQIKNPIAAINGVLQLLCDEVPAKDPRQEIFRELGERTSRLEKTVKHLLSLARPWSPDKQRFDLLEVVQHVSELMKREEAFQNIRFSYRGRVSGDVLLDLMLFEEVLRNVLSNSAQAMPGGGRIRFTLGETPERVVVRISDSGPGMNEEVQNRLFRPFFTTKSQGTGLGLYICKRIMEAHGGSIRVESEAGRGTDVELQLPKS